MTSKTVLIDAADSELASAVHENLYALFSSMQVIPGCEVIENDELGYHHAFPDNPMFKGVWKTRLSPDKIDAEIDKAIAWFERRNTPSFFWWTDSQSQPLDLVERLLRRGFDGNLEGDPGMALDLNTVNTETGPPNDLSIVRAIDQKTLDDWQMVFAPAFEADLSAGRAWVEATLEAGGANAPWQLYVGYLEDKPVAISILFMGAGVAGIYGVGTLPELRRKGFGTAITLKSLQDARRQGYRFAVLFATRMGYPIYQRLGFREVTNKIGIYILEKE